MPREHPAIALRQHLCIGAAAALHLHTNAVWEQVERGKEWGDGGGREEGTANSFLATSSVTWPKVMPQSTKTVYSFSLTSNTALQFHKNYWKSLAIS